jgi:hypothetical protein
MAFSTTPKRYSSTPQGKATWYSYYAGFSPAFVKAALTALDLPAKAKIIDPWNGSGTTSEIADELGFAAVGYDINPVMVMVAKARLLPSTIRPSHDSLCEDIVQKATKFDGSFEEDDPLLDWFTPGSARVLRNIERSIQHLLVSKNAYTYVADLSDLSQISGLAAFFYVALFRVVRQLAHPFAASNPTWHKVPGRQSRVRPSSDTLFALFRENVSAMALAQWGELTEPKMIADASRSRSAVRLGDSTRLPDVNGSYAAAICSPPYCTRIVRLR